MGVLGRPPASSALGADTHPSHLDIRYSDMVLMAVSRKGGSYTSGLDIFGETLKPNQAAV